LHNQTGDIYSCLLFLFPVLALIILNSLDFINARASVTSPRQDEYFSTFCATRDEYKELSLLN
jgi:hypothetical protein